MKLTKRQGRFLQKVIVRWQAEGTLNEEEAEKLTNSFTVQSFDWKKLAKYSFWIAIVCALISFVAVVADDYIIHFIENIFASSNIALCIALSIIAAVFYYLGLKGRNARPEKTFSNEALLFIGALFTAGAIAYLGRALDNGSGHFSILFLLGALVYGALGISFTSRMLWVFALLSLGVWYGAEIDYQSGHHAYGAIINYPLTYVIFGAGVVALSLVFKYVPRLILFNKPTYRLGLLYLFISLWVLSVFGNYNDLDRWYTIRQSELLPWSLLFAVITLVVIVFGIKTEDGIARGFGITFLFINLYTRYFEYCWNGIHKAVFFFILALSFGIIGRWAERIWNIGAWQKAGDVLQPDDIVEEED